MPTFTKKKVYANRYIREMTKKPEVLTPAAQIILIMIILVVSTMMQIQSMMSVG